MTPEGVTELYRAERSGLTRSVARIAGDEAEDLVHDAFLAFMVAGPDASRPGAWVQRVARNRALNHVRRLRSVPLDDATPDDGEEPGAPAVRDASRAVVAEALTSLPPRSREALRLRYYEGLDYEDIARKLDVRVGQAHVVVHRSIRRLGREVVRVLAAAHGAEACAPALLRLAGLGEGAEAGHETGPCTRCASTWDELVALRALPGLAFVPVPRFGRLREALARAWSQAAALADPAASAGTALLALGVSVSTLVQPSVPTAPAPRSGTGVAVSAPAPERVPANTVVRPQEAAATSSVTGVGAPTQAAPKPLPQSGTVTKAGPATIKQEEDYSQGEVNRGGSGQSGVVICKPLEPCPPPPSPTPSP